MAKKEKGHGRHIYFRDATLWERLQVMADDKRWSINQVIEIALSEIYPKPKANG